MQIRKFKFLVNRENFVQVSWNIDFYTVQKQIVGKRIQAQQRFKCSFSGLLVIHFRANFSSGLKSFVCNFIFNITC